MSESTGFWPSSLNVGTADESVVVTLEDGSTIEFTRLNSAPGGVPRLDELKDPVSVVTDPSGLALIDGYTFEPQGPGSLLRKTSRPAGSSARSCVTRR